MARPICGPRRYRHVRRRRYAGFRRAFHLRHARPAADGAGSPVHQGGLPAPVHQRRASRRRRRRPGHRADRQTPAEPLLPRTHRVRPAAGRRVRRRSGPAAAHPVPDRVRGGDRDPDRRAPRRRAARDGPGGPGLAAEPPPAAVGPDQDELRRVAGAGRPGSRAGARGGRTPDARPVGSARTRRSGDLPARGRYPGRAASRRAPHRGARASAHGPGAAHPRGNPRLPGQRVRDSARSGPPGSAGRTGPAWSRPRR